MKSRSPKVVPMPAPPPERVSDEEWDQLARETFKERKTDVGRVPDRRREPTPTWYPPETKTPEPDK
jgi:hypothetical protein